MILLFYEMISKFGLDALSEIPDDIEEALGENKISELTGKDIENTTDSLDFMWKKTKEICKNYIHTKWIDDLNIDKDVLLDDIKTHSIFIIYLSIINQDLEEKDIEKCEEDYFHFIAGDKEADKLENSFRRKLEILLQDIANGVYGDGFTNSDLHYYFCEGIEVKDYDNYIVHIDSLIFSQIVSTWSKCPYNVDNSNGMTFKKLFKFYKDFEKLIVRSNNSLDKYTRVFIIERLFNISFLFNLVRCLDDDIIKHNKEYERTDKYNISSANKLLVLSELVSIPIVFSRNKYIQSINTLYESNINDLNWKSKFRCGIYYLNTYLIPLLIRLYYIILFYNFLKEDDGNICIKNLLEEYIKENSQKYNYKNFYEVDENSLKKLLTADSLQVNATEIIYSYKYHRDKIKFSMDCKNESERILQVDMEKGKIREKIRIKKNDKKVYDIFENMKDIEKEIYHQELYNFNYKYDYNFYMNNFPNNILYSNYKNKKK